MNFVALNNELSSSSALPTSSYARPTLEAQESACLERYHSAIRLQQNGKFDAAIEIYREILESAVMEELGGASQSTTLSKLKYLVYKNIASIARERGDLSCAVDAFIEALTIDASDVSMWCQLASCASALGNLLLAKRAYRLGLECNDHYWPVIEGLCTVLLALEDYLGCLQVIKRSLKQDSDFPRGLVYFHHISEHCAFSELIQYSLTQFKCLMMRPPPSDPGFLKEALEMRARSSALMGVVVLQEDLVADKKLSSLTVLGLGSWVLGLYKQCKELSNKTPSYCCKVDMTGVLDNASAEPVTVPPPTHTPAPAAEGETPESKVVPPADECKKDAKRRLMDELEIIAPKRRSNRVKAIKVSTPVLQQGQSHFELLSEYLPLWLALGEAPDLQGLSPLKRPKEDHNKNASEERKRELAALIQSVATIDEVKFVSEFIEGCSDNTGVLNIVKKYLLLVAENWSSKWSSAPLAITKLYCELFECFYPHITLPSIYSTMAEVNEPDFKSIALIALCYTETFVDTKRALNKKTTGSDYTASKCFTECLHFVYGVAGLAGDSERDRTVFALRAVWVRAKWAKMCSDNNLAAERLHQLERMLLAHRQVLKTPDIAICVPNLKFRQVISLANVQDDLRQLERCVSANEIQGLYNDGQYSTVITRLQSLFDQEPSLDLMIGKAVDERTPLSLLLSSLLQVQHYHSCIMTATQCLVLLLSRSNHGNEHWNAAVKDIFISIDKCLPSPEDNSEVASCNEREGPPVVNEMDEVDVCTRQDLLDRCDLRLLQRIVMSVIKTMDLVSDSSENAVFQPLPVALLWKIFYIIIASGWSVASEAVSQPAPLESESPLANPPATNESPVEAMDTTPPPQDRAPRDTSPTATPMDTPSPALQTQTPSNSLPSSMDSLPANLKLLLKGHDYLGRLGWCCKDQGSFLKMSVKILRKELKQLQKLPPKQREMLLVELEQCYYCLYGHPQKKAKTKGLVEHNSTQVPLTWDSSLLLIEYFHPSPLPAVEDSKSSQVTTELISLYKRIVGSLPKHGKVISRDDTLALVEGTATDSEIVRMSPHEHTTTMAELYYLIADDALKSGDLQNAVLNYQHTLSYSPDNFDCWAGLALARSRKILERLNIRDVKAGMERIVQKQTQSIVNCFERAVAINKKHCFILEKFGLFTYAVHSFCSRMLNQPELCVLQDVHSWARETQGEMLLLAQSSFTQALELGDSKNSHPWLYHFFLGKIARKLSRPMEQVLDLFIKSAECLQSEGALYPDTVELTGKHFSVEAIEVHYQLHNSVVKALLKQPLNSFTSETVAHFKPRLELLPLNNTSYPDISEWLSSLLKTCTEKHFTPTNMELLKASLYGIAVCAVRCPLHFKSIYRLSAVFYWLGLPGAAKELLFGPIPPSLLEKQDKLLKLFVLRPNIFTNMWQIPLEEINRPGNFSSHARRNLSLLLEVLSVLHELHPLSYIAQQLKNKPDSTRQYMRDNERPPVFKLAVKYSVKALKAKVSQASSLTQEKLAKAVSIANSLKPLVRAADLPDLTKDVNKAIKTLKTFVVPSEDKSKGKDSKPETSDITKVEKVEPLKLDTESEPISDKEAPKAIDNSDSNRDAIQDRKDCATEAVNKSGEVKDDSKLEAGSSSEPKVAEQLVTEALVDSATTTSVHINITP